MSNTTNIRSYHVVVDPPAEAVFDVVTEEKSDSEPLVETSVPGSFQ